MFDLISKYYRMGLYKKEDVAAFVVSGTITPEQYKEITGEEYVPVTPTPGPGPGDPTYDELQQAVNILMGEENGNE